MCDPGTVLFQEVIDVGGNCIDIMSGDASADDGRNEITFFQGIRTNGFDPLSWLVNIVKIA
jgi:hypothetical protein